MWLCLQGFVRILNALRHSGQQQWDFHALTILSSMRIVKPFIYNWNKQSQEHALCLPEIAVWLIWHGLWKIKISRLYHGYNHSCWSCGERLVVHIWNTASSQLDSTFLMCLIGKAVMNIWRQSQALNPSMQSMMVLREVWSWAQTSCQHQRARGIITMRCKLLNKIDTDSPIYANASRLPSDDIVMCEWMIWLTVIVGLYCTLQKFVFTMNAININFFKTYVKSIGFALLLNMRNLPIQ